MKRLIWLLAAVAIASFGFCGCSKKAEAPVDSLKVNGVAVDMPKLHSTFSSSTNSDIQKLIFDADQGFRYGDYNKALAAVDELSTKPDLTEEEKKVTTDVLEQLKKLTGATPAAAPAQ